MKLHVAQFLDGFVRPLVEGGDLHVGAPVAISDVERWDGELPHASVEQVAVDDARTSILSTLVCRPPAFLLDADDLALAAGLYDALFLVHPRADKWSVSDRQRRKIIDTALALVSRPLTQNRTRVMARHALLHNLFHISRADTTVSWWTGRARFQGQKPPARLTAWKGVRRVREDTTVVDFDELLAVPETAPVIATLLRRTPLTQLLDSHPGAPPLHWEDAVFLLRDAELARAVAYRLVPDGGPRDQILGPSRLAAAFEQMLERAPDERDVRAVAAFLVHLGALFSTARVRCSRPCSRPRRRRSDRAASPRCSRCPGRSRSSTRAWPSHRGSPISRSSRRGGRFIARRRSSCSESR
ncbi:MAG: hypothetical protein NT062_02900 [Proteobacteria bacterium]|nr:hypothetical protein [Pseudomonadota bacterium]